jgi:glycosyltransferase involved in cell wall biosynthesis
MAHLGLLFQKLQGSTSRLIRVLQAMIMSVNVNSLRSFLVAVTVRTSKPKNLEGVLDRFAFEKTDPVQQSSVSVIIPFFNGSKFIKQTIESVSRASRFPIQLVIVDDGSTAEESLVATTFLSECGQQNIVYVKQTNRGLASARNVGLEHATGEFIKFLDCDDLLLPGSIDFEVGQIYGHDADAHISRVIYWLENWALGTQQSKHSLEFANSSLGGRPRVLFCRWEQGLTIPIHSALFRQSSLVQFEAGLRNKEDFVFWMDFLKTSPRLRFSPEIVALYRVHDSQMTKAPSSTQQEAMEKAINIIAEKFDGEISDEEIRRKRAHLRSAYRSPNNHNFGL